MRNIFNLRFFAALLCGVVALFAQSCDNPTNNTVEGYAEIECKAGDKPSFTFTAGGDWQLSSDKTWCKFYTPTGSQQEMSGAAGTHTITLDVTDDNITNSWTKANITIRIGDKSAVIAIVKRGPKEILMQIADTLGDKKEAFDLGYIDWKEWRIRANFCFTAIEIPEWIEIAYKDESGAFVTSNYIEGEGESVSDDAVTIYMRIVCDGNRERYPIKKEDGHTIKFSDESGDHTFAFPVTYGGMGSDKLTFTGPTEQIYGWEVSLDGKTFRQHIDTNDTNITFSDELVFEIAAQNDEYNVIFIEQKFDRGISTYQHVGTKTGMTAFDKPCWMHFDLKEMTLTIDESTSTRYGVVMALPISIYNKIQSQIETNIFSSDSASGIELPTIADDYKQFVIMEFTQRDFSKEEPMYVYHSLTTIEISVQEYDDTDTPEEYNAEEVFGCPFVNSIAGKKPGIVIDPRIENWTTLYFESGNATAEVYHKGEKLKISEDEYYLGENKDENMALYLWGPKDGWQGENVYIIFKVDGVAKKLLVVTPPAN